MISGCRQHDGISAIIVNYNSGSHLSMALESIQEKCYQIIVVDNFSADESVRLARDVSPGGINGKFILNDSNLGFAKACNIGFHACGGENLLFLNPDCTSDRRSLGAMLRVLQTPGVGMVGGLLLNPDGSEQAGGRRNFPTPGKALGRFSGWTRISNMLGIGGSFYDLNEQKLPDSPIEVEAVSGACMMVKREALEDVGLLDEGYFLHCEDLDLCMRFREKGWRIMFVPDAKITHQKGGCSRSRPVFVEYHKHKGMLRFYKKFYQSQYPGPLMALVWIAVWCRFGVLAAGHLASSWLSKLR